MVASRVRGTIALVGAAATLGLLGPGHGARADDANRECDNNNDVTVVVDFHELIDGDNNDVNVRCAVQPVESGFGALDRANVSYATYRGFVCRIAGLPDASHEPCNRYPPDNAYWVYWVAQRGGAWCYSNYGAGARTPPPGSIDGWSFAKNRGKTDLPPPRYPVPPPIPGTTPHPLNGGECSASQSPTTTRSTSPAPAPVSPPAGHDHERPDAPDAATTTSAVGKAVETGSSASSSTSISSATSASSTIGGAAASSPSSIALGHVDLSDDRAGDSSAMTFVTGAGAVTALAAAGLWVARRRRG